MPHTPKSKQNQKIVSSRHPDYTRNLGSWQKFRLTFEGGERFVDTYTKKFSLRESESEYRKRKEISYSPSHAKAALMDIKNAIFQRSFDISREGGPFTYQQAVKGENGGVDRRGHSMNGFIGTIVLPELLSIGRVGVYVDKDPVTNIRTKRDEQTVSPYVFHYPAEDILSWNYDSRGILTALLLRDHLEEEDTRSGLFTGTKVIYRLLQKTPKGVRVVFYDDDDKVLSRKFLNLNEIPFHYFTIDDSLLKDVADYQIALLNLASSDMTYALKSNYPFYTEQYDPKVELPHLKPSTPSHSQIDAKAGDFTTETHPEPNQARDKDVNVGVAQGRRYGKDLERPDFIHPSPEPLRVSMEKQETLKKEIRQLVNLALANLSERPQSAESKQVDQQGLEAGLSYIGMELQYGEQRLAEIWSDYEGHKNQVLITYPDRYSLKGEQERIEEAKGLGNLVDKTPSLTYKRELAKRIINLTLGSRVSNEILKMMHNEIDQAPAIQIDPEQLRDDVEAGLVGEELASRIRGYPLGEVDKAREDHALRAARIARAQSSPNDPDNDPGSRGIGDLDVTKGKSAKEEKDKTQDSTLDPGERGRKTRGRSSKEAQGSTETHAIS